MKSYKILSILAFALLWSTSCQEDFLEVTPPGSYSDVSLQNATGVEGMLIATYSALDGSWFESWGNNFFNQDGGSSNWGWGGIRSDDSYKGTEESDGVDWNAVERAETQPNNPKLNSKWRASYDGIGLANTTLKNLALALDEFSPDVATRIEAEAKFLRGHFHFEAAKVFGRGAPYVDETVEDFAAITNSDAIIWPQIEADLLFAYQNLPGVMPNEGRVNKYAAGALYAKALIFQAKWAEAKAVLDDVINNGTTSTGVALGLIDQFHHVFRADFEQGNPELLFGYEAAFGDGSISNGNYENTLNQPHGSSARTSCCGFFQPSQNLANSYKTENGLPIPSRFNTTDIVNDEGVPADASFAPEPGELDPRIDWTIGRRGIPFLDWGMNPGSTSGWVRNVPNGGIYNPVKSVPSFAEFDAELAGVINWGFTSSAKNVHIIRFADVLLLAAEVEAELGNLAPALGYVNQVRARAANPDGFVKMEDGTPAANYVINEYTAFADQTEALTAIRFERKIELAMEGHRMFDIVRWHVNRGSSAAPFDGIAFMNDYLSVEQQKRSHLAGSSFAEKDLYQPVPVAAITQNTVGGVQNLTQNPGYN